MNHSPRQKPTILVSACLLGQRVRYDANANPIEDRPLDQLRQLAKLEPFCPECAGGLSVPRRPAEIQGADGLAVLDGQASILNDEGEDVTAAFLRGAQAALQRAEQLDIKLALLKARSPSCGSQQIYDGSFCGRRVPGSGITAALLQRAGIQVFHEQQLDQLLALLASQNTSHYK